MGRSRFVRIGASLMSSLLLQARNLVISVVVFRLFADPTTLWGTVNQVAATVRWREDMLRELDDVSTNRQNNSKEGMS